MDREQIFLLGYYNSVANRVERVGELFDVVTSDVPARLWPVSPGFGPQALGFGLEKSRPGPTETAQAWPGLALAQAGAFWTSHKTLKMYYIT